MPQTPSAIANEFVRLNQRPLPQMKMQKLTFIANGWNLAIFNRPLVDEQAEAWDNGPVYREIWDRIRDLGVTLAGLIMDYQRRPEEAHLDTDEAAIIQHVWRKYGSLSANTLSDMTHQPGTPWTRAYFERGRNAWISDEDVRAHYRELALAGRAVSA